MNWRAREGQKHVMRKPSLLAGAVVTVVTASVAAYYGTSRQGDAPKLSTTTITKGDVVETVAATGTLQAVTTVQGLDPIEALRYE
jgi:multidrug efflux pump subunit AcrA (membrane-fusion protein)